MAVEHTRWMQDGRVRARCRDCSWRDAGENPSTVGGRARRHVEHHGHNVEVTRAKWKLIMPAEEEA